MQMHRNLMQTERLNRCLEDNLIAIDIKAAAGDCSGNVARRDRAVKIAGFARLTDDDEDLTVQLFGYSGGLGPRLEIARFELGPLAFKPRLIGLSRPQSFALGKEKIAGIAILDPDGFTHLAKLADAFEQNNFHHEAFRVVPELLLSGFRQTRRLLAIPQGEGRVENADHDQCEQEYQPCYVYG